MEYLICDKAYFDDLLEMALDLWKDFPENELEKALGEIGASEHKEVFFAKDQELLVGFVYVVPYAKIMLKAPMRHQQVI